MKALGAMALLLALVISLGMPATAANVEVIVEADGGTHADAIANALAEAVREVAGVSIDARQLLTTSTRTGSVSDSDGNSASFQLNQEQQGTIAASAKGFLAGYRVLAVDRTEYGFHARVRAEVVRYQAPGLPTDKRRRLALIPFNTSLRDADFFGLTSGENLVAELSDALLTQFVQARRFAVLDRESWGVIQNERARLESSATPVSEKGRLIATLGADYVVLGELTDADGGVESYTARLTGQKKMAAVARIAVTYRILVPATGEIKFTDKVELSLNDPGAASISSRTAALNELSKRLVGIALDRIFPIRVVALQGTETAVLNQGGATLSVGDRLRLLEEGEAVFDPYTHEPLGRAEREIGHLEVVRVDGKMTYARVDGGEGEVLRIGQIARRDDQLYAVGRPTDVIPPPSPRREGVRLPGDKRP